MVGIAALSAGAHHRVLSSVGRSTDALSNACMVAEALFLVPMQRLKREQVADFFLIREHQSVPAGKVVSPNGSRGG